MTKRTTTRTKTKSSNRRKSTSSRSGSRSSLRSSSSSLLSNPFNLKQDKKLLMVVFAAVALVAAFFIYRANAQEFTAVVPTGFDENCTSSAGTAFTEEDSSSLKRSFSICNMQAGNSMSPNLYHYGRGVKGTYSTVINQMKSKGYNRIRTCAYLQSTNGTATVELYGLGKQGTKKTVNPTTADYQEFCTTQSIEGTNQNAKIKVISGAVRVSSMVMEGQVVVVPPSNDTSYVTPSDVGVTVGARGNLSSRSGDITLSANETLKDTRLNGCITVGGHNVTIDNVEINCGDWKTITNGGGYDNLTVKNSTLDCQGANETAVILYGGAENLTFDRNEITRCGEGIYWDDTVGDSRVTNSVFHNNVNPGGRHADGIQLGSSGVVEGKSTLLVQGNYWNWDYPEAAVNAILFNGNNNNITIKVYNNYLDADFGYHVLRCTHSRETCDVQNNVMGGGVPDGFLLLGDGSTSSVAKCNRLPNGDFVPNQYINGATIDNSNCQ